MAVKKLRLLVVGVALALVVVGAFLWWRWRSDRERSARRAEAAQAWADLQRCTLGEPKGGAGVPERVRLIELAGERERGWPQRCSTHADALYRALDADPEQASDGAQLLRSELVERFACDDRCAVDQPATQFVGLAEVVAQAGVEGGSSTVPAPSSLGADLLSREDFPSFAPADAAVVDHDRLDDGRLRLLLLGPESGMSACEVRSAGDAAR
jgi:hypothetical protein